MNANTSQPVGRALVQVGSQAILTGRDGTFQFVQASGSSASLRVTKPGFFDGLDPNSPGKRITFGVTAGPITIYLYPEALITGALTTTNGDPLAGIYILALRRSGDEYGEAWLMAGQTSTNADGQFRLPVSAGDYVLETHYMFDRPIREKAILPMMVPATAGNFVAGAQLTIHLESGSEEHLEVHPEVRSVHDVHVWFDGMLGQGFPAVEAHLANGLSFFPMSRTGSTPGEFISSLPSGSYALTVATNDRDEGRYAQTTVEVGEKDVSGVVLETVRTIAMPVEVVGNTSAPSPATSDNQLPSVQQLGLRFVRTDRGSPATVETVYPRSSHGGTLSFSFKPGRYRLLTQAVSHWYIESATVGGTDLLTQDYEVEVGGTSEPLRIVMSNNTASVRGKVTLNGKPGASCWIYLVASSGGIGAVISVVSGSDGTFSHSSIPPGSYRVVAFESRHSEDFADPGTRVRLSSYMKSLSVEPGEVGSVELDVVPTLELPN